MSETLESPEKNAPDVKPRRLRHSVLVLPSLITVANLFCGYYAILLTMNEQYWQAAAAIVISTFLDYMDGFIARLTHTSSDFGMQLDSLADAVSFGIAPSILVLKWGLLSTIDPRLAIAAAFTYTICGAMRLARFNIQSGSRKSFVGMPITAAGGLMAAIVYFFRDPVTNQMYAYIMLAITFILAFMMISTLRYDGLKGITLGKKSHFSVLVIALLFVLIFFLSRPTLLTIGIVYALSGPAMKVYGMLRHKKAET